MTPIRILQGAFAAQVALAIFAAHAEACSPVPPTYIYFQSNSAELGKQKGAVDRFKERFGKINPKCVNFRLSVRAESSEANVSDGSLLSNRADAVTRRLVELGFEPGRIRLVRLDVLDPRPVEPGKITVPESYVKIEDGFSKGRIRCDPATRNESSHPAACIGEYRHCYLEMEDGTICNIYNVPDPNPQKYSVTSDKFLWGGFGDGQSK